MLREFDLMQLLWKASPWFVLKLQGPSGAESSASDQEETHEPNDGCEPTDRHEIADCASEWL